MTWVIGHRGAPTAHRENTLAALLAAVGVGADGVELDVRRTSDGALAVHHDAVLPEGAPISNISAAELPAWVPGLPAVFEVLPPGALIDVEIKNVPTEPDWDPDERVAAAVADLIGRHARHAATIVTSFNLNTVDVVRQADPAIRTGWLTLPGYDHAWALDTVVERGHRVIAPRHESADAALVDAAHSQGVEVWVWTVDEPEQMRAMADIGVDAVVTNVPEVAVEVLARA